MKQRFTKLLAAFALLVGLTVPMGMWGQTTSTANASKVTSSTFSWTSTDNAVTWSGTVEGGAINQNVTEGYAQIGTKNSPSTSVTLTTSSIAGTITSVVLDCASYSGIGTVSATVGGSAFGTQSQSIPTWSNNSGGEVIFTGSATGNIVVTMTNGTGGRAMYIKSISVTYTTGGGGTTYNVNIANNIIGGSILASPTSQEAGQSVTLTANPNSAYTFNNIAANWSVTYGDETVQVTPGDNNTATFEMPESDVTVSATFTPKPTYSIIIANDIENGSVTASPESAYEGQTVNLTVEPDEGFALNTLTATYVNGSGETQTFSISNNTFQMPNSNVTINATFISNTFEGTFEKYTETIVEGDYLLVYNNKAMNNDNATTSNKLQYKAVAPDNNNIINPDRSIVWHIAPSATSGYWTIYNAACNKYVSGGTSNTNISLVSNATNDGAKWSVASTTTHDFRSRANEGQSTSRYIRYFSDNDVYGNYASSNGGALTLYKLKQSVAPAWSTEFPTTASILTDAIYELTVSDFVSGEPAPSITLATEVSSSLYEFEDGEFMFGSSTAGTYVFNFTAANSAGTTDVTLTITVSAPVQVNYYYSANGVLDSGTSITQGQSVTLANGSDFNSDYIFAGWTLNPNDIENILLAGSTQTINEETTFYAVYSKTESVAESKVVILDGSGLGSSVTTEEIEYNNNGFNYTISAGAKLQTSSGDNRFADKAILIGKNGAYIHNIDAFGQGITKFEVYANKGASAKVSVGINFSTNAINEYNAIASNTWSETLSTLDHVYDASSALPTGAKYFWYQVTNENNSQIQFRITYTSVNSTTDYYTRIYTQDITGYGENKYGYTLIASPINGVNPENVAGMTEGNFDLYRFNESAELEWENWKQQDGNHYQFNLERGKGYLYAHKTNVTLAFAGTPVQNTDFEVTLSNSGTEYKGMNLVGNPFGQTAYIDRDFFVMNAAGSGFIQSSGAIAPMQGIIVDAANGTTLIFTTEAPSNSGDAKVALNLSRNRGDVIDRAIVRFGEGSQLHKFQLRENSTKVYFTEDNQDFAVVRSQKAQGEMPVNFKAEENGTYTLSVNTEEMELNYLHLIDNMTGMDVDLLQTPSYTFDATTNDYASRFRLVFSANDVNEQNAETFAFFSNGNWVVGNEGEATLQVIDVNGRIVSNETINGTVATSINATPGVYMLRLVNGNEVKTQKIVVK